MSLQPGRLLLVGFGLAFVANGACAHPRGLPHAPSGAGATGEVDRAKPDAAPADARGEPSERALVRTIDWKNRAYEGVGERGDTYLVRGGAFEFGYDAGGNMVPIDSVHGDAEQARGFFKVGDPVFGDVTGDGVEEAAILTTLNTGGSGNFTSVVVYGVRGGQAMQLGSIRGGDRGLGGIRAVTIEQGAIAVERLMSLPGDGACCPSIVDHEIWRWNGKGFVHDASERRRERLDR
jgi:hypothetical protein